MRRRIVIAVLVSLLLTLLAGAGRISQAYADEFLGRYPGAVAVDAEDFDVGQTQPNAFTWQGEYQTGDYLADVQRWYVTRLHLAPASDMNLSGDCVWLAQAKLFYRIERKVSVLLCSTHDGTSVVVNESVSIVP